ncbi:MAG TPA: hypothetical protein VI076_13475 [Actinopolymorphaceae bacterium]
MPLYEVLLDDWDEIRLTSEPMNVGEFVEIDDADWLVVGVAKTPDHTIRYLCVRRDAEAVREEAQARRRRAQEAVERTRTERLRTERRAGK